MSDREKMLAAAVGLLIAMWGGNWAWQNYSQWQQSAATRQINAATDLQSAQFELSKARAAVKKLRAWREKSLPASVAVAQSQYRAWLVEQLQAANLEIADVSPRSTGQQSAAYQALGYDVEATGKLAGVVEFLDTFYRSDQLHKIGSLRLAPQNDAKELRITLNIEALVVRGTDRNEGLSDGVADRLILDTAEEYVERISKRNPFVAYTPRPAPKPKVVERPRPKPTQKPEFNHAEHARLTGVVSDGEEFQAWVTVQTLGERLYLRTGDDVDIGQFKGTVVDVFEKELLVDTDEGVISVRVGREIDRWQKAHVHSCGQLASFCQLPPGCGTISYLRIPSSRSEKCWWRLLNFTDYSGSNDSVIRRVGLRGVAAPANAVQTPLVCGQVGTWKAKASTIAVELDCGWPRLRSPLLALG